MEVISRYCVGFIYVVDVGGEGKTDVQLTKSLRGKRTHAIGQQGVKSKNDP